jgi:2-(1,2-epoxy-1,2-dihydrophenyl)acetyl-CoA isomerase
MNYSLILAETRGRVGLITLNRPEKLNAWSGKMMAEMRNAMDAWATDPAVGAVVVTGAGRAFCAGADIVAVFATSAAAADEGRTSGSNDGDSGENNWVRYIQHYPKPTLAAINGIAVGIGITQVLPFDMRIGSELARIGFFFIKMGLTPELASSHLLPQMVGTARAADWCLTGRLVPAEEAREAGLLSEVVPADRLLDRAIEIGEQLAGNAAPAMVLIRELLRENANDSDLDSVLSRESVALAASYASWEHREAIAAFSEKRAPNFTRRP